jgi:heat-inducible transcriptional repressor
MSEIAFPGGPRRDDPELSERQRHIFLSLLELHRRTSQPVGSDALSRVPGVPWSPAGIRTTLAELESLGMLHRGHASAGRLPTPAGYAFHVRRELEPAPLAASVLREVDERLRRASRDVEALLAEASRLLSELTFQMGLAVAAAFEQERLVHLELQPLGPRRALMALGLGGGVVHTVVLPLESELDEEALFEAAEALRSRLVGLTLGQVRMRLATDLELIDDATVRIVSRAATASWGHADGAWFSAGAGEFATQPEFADRERLGSLLRVVESGPPLDRLMVDTVEGQAAVHVALDQDRALTGLSLVSFALPGRQRAGLGVLGPLRMDYARCLAVVDAVGARVADYL